MRNEIVSIQVLDDYKGLTIDRNEELELHLIFKVKMDLTRKDRWSLEGTRLMIQRIPHMFEKF